MSKFVFHFQGSAAEPYTIIVEKVDLILTASCDCPAGTMGQICKHRTQLFRGDASGVVGGDLEKVVELPAMIVGTNVAGAFDALDDAEKAEEAAKKRTKAAKAALARTLQGK